MTRRTPPSVSDITRDFWTGGSVEELRIQRCDACGQWQHPPRLICGLYGGRELSPRPVSGRGTLWSYTVSRIGWGGIEPPYVVAEVELEEQPGLRLISAIVGFQSLKIGMDVVVAFEPADDTWIPVFRSAELP